MTVKETPISGMSSPTFLTYPKIQSLSDTPSILGIYCNVIKHYGNDGVACMIKRNGDDVMLKIGDWKGNVSDTPPAELLDKTIWQLLKSMHCIKIDQAQFFFAKQGDDFFLVDVQLSQNKFASPGMVAEVFGKVVPVQQVVTMAVLDKQAVAAIDDNSGSYAGNIILKPSRHRPYEIARGVWAPLYAEVIR